MLDPRVARLAEILVGYCCKVQPNDNVLVEAFDVSDDVITAIVRQIVAAEGRPFVSVKRNAVLRALYSAATEKQMELTGRFETNRMENMQAYIGLRGAINSSELSDVPEDKMKLYRRLWWNKTHSEARIKGTKWVVLRFPLPAMAQEAGMSTEAFEDYYFNVCTFNYKRLAEAVRPLQELMERTDRVHIVSPGTDLRFSKKDIPAIACTGEFNIPDGECFTAPVRESVQGRITFNAPTTYSGKYFDGISLLFKDGKIVDATASAKSDELNSILDSDDGARYVGEFSLGLNPFILRPMRDILFDEKITGSLHFTPGNAYENADNGNRSVVHWDMVLMQRAEHGGGELYFDDKLIRKDGIFVLPELEPLNPENLMEG